MLLALIVACVKVPGSDEVNISATLPGMNRGCDRDEDDVTRDSGDRVFGLIEPDGTDCRGIAYAKVKALDWQDVRADVGDKKATWQEFVAQLNGAKVVTNPPLPLDGVSVRLLQLFATGSELAGYDADPEALFTRLDAVPKIVGSDAYVVSLEHTFTGDEPEDLADIMPNGVDTYAFNDIPGPIETIQRSFDNDKSLYVITLGEVLVPIAALEAALPQDSEELVEVTIDLVEGLDYRIKVKLL